MPRWVSQLLELTVVSAAFALSSYFFRDELELFDWTDPVLTTLVFWAVFSLWRFDPNRSTWVQAIERTSLGMGFNLQLRAVLLYTALQDSTSLSLSSALVAGVLMAAIRIWTLRPKPQSILFLGDSGLSQQMAGDMGAAVWGMLAESPPAASTTIPYLGGFDNADALIAQHKPARILYVDESIWTGLEQRKPKWQEQGILVEPLTIGYENLYLRVCSQGLKPVEILTSPAMAASPTMMSLQATYSNLIGLAFLITLLPLMLVLAILSRLAAGPGSILDRVECAGFQGIPFQRLHFRIRSGATGKMTWIGWVIAFFRLTGLPQLINLVRGEMAMFGPAPARRCFQQELERIIPPYSHRLSMRPGVLGWAQVHLTPRLGVREEVLQMEYDLYYIKQCSPSLDFEIFLRAMFRMPHFPSKEVS